MFGLFHLFSSTTLFHLLAEHYLIDQSNITYVRHIYILFGKKNKNHYVFRPNSKTYGLKLLQKLLVSYAENYIYLLKTAIYLLKYQIAPRIPKYETQIYETWEGSTDNIVEQPHNAKLHLSYNNLSVECKLVATCQILNLIQMTSRCRRILQLVKLSIKYINLINGCVSQNFSYLFCGRTIVKYYLPFIFVSQQQSIQPKL